MSWQQYTIIIPASRQQAGNNAGTVFDPDTGGALTFNTGYCSSSGNTPPTHIAIQTPANPDMIQAFGQAFGADVYRVYAHDAGWTHASALADAGLQVIGGEELPTNTARQAVGLLWDDNAPTHGAEIVTTWETVNGYDRLIKTVGGNWSETVGYTSPTLGSVEVVLWRGTLAQLTQLQALSQQANSNFSVLYSEAL